MNWLIKLIPIILNIAKAMAGAHPVGLLVIKLIESIIDNVNDGISNKSAKDIIVNIAKSKRNDIDQDKLIKALKILGLDTVTKEEMEGVPETPKKKRAVKAV